MTVAKPAKMCVACRMVGVYLFGLGAPAAARSSTVIGRIVTRSRRGASTFSVAGTIPAMPRPVTLGASLGLAICVAACETPLQSHGDSDDVGLTPAVTTALK